MNSRIIALSAALAVAIATPAFASSLPRADFAGSKPTIGLGVGSGTFSGAFDVPVDRDWQIGLGGSYKNPGADVDLRVLWRFWNAGANPLTLAVLFGGQGTGGTFGSLGNFEPIVGLAAAYPITGQLTVRANLVAGGTSAVNFRPAGIELAYRFAPNLEGTLGGNGRGDFVGLNILI